MALLGGPLACCSGLAPAKRGRGLHTFADGHERIASTRVDKPPPIRSQLKVPIDVSFGNDPGNGQPAISRVERPWDRCPSVIDDCRNPSRRYGPPFPFGPGSNDRSAAPIERSSPDPQCRLYAQRGCLGRLIGPDDLAHTKPAGAQPLPTDRSMNGGAWNARRYPVMTASGPELGPDPRL